MKIIKFVFALLVIIVACGSCADPIPKRPFIIISKQQYNNGQVYEYRYIDAHGYYHYFDDEPGKYSVGDTL